MSHQDTALKDRWNFYLSIELPEQLQHLAKPIELMVAGVDLGAESLQLAPGPSPDNPEAPEDSVHHRTGRLIIWLYDDVKSELMRSIRKLQYAQPVFTIKVVSVEHRDGPELETFLYTGCQLEALQHSMYSYERTGEDLKLELRSEPDYRDKRRTITGSLTNSNQKPVAMKLLQVAFSNVQHIIHTKAQ